MSPWRTSAPIPSARARRLRPFDHQPTADAVEIDTAGDEFRASGPDAQDIPYLVPVWLQRSTTMSPSATMSWMVQCGSRPESASRSAASGPPVSGNGVVEPLNRGSNGRIRSRFASSTSTRSRRRATSMTGSMVSWEPSMRTSTVRGARGGGKPGRPRCTPAATMTRCQTSAGLYLASFQVNPAACRR